MQMNVIKVCMSMALQSVFLVCRKVLKIIFWLIG